jgi:DNA-binding CsgD family transcriptional regulator
MIRAGDVRQLFRLMNECREIRDAGQRPSRHFLRGLREIVRSEVCLHMQASRVRADSTPIFHAVDDLGWGSESDRDRVYSYVTDRNLGDDPLCAALLRRPGRVVTLARADVMTTAAWVRTEVHNDVHRPSGVDDSVLSMRRNAPDPEEAAVLVLKRTCNATPFGEEERELVALAHAESEWIFEEPGSKLTEQDGFSPRERETLALLLTGTSEKCVAARLGLSRHTVHDYVKAIYKKLGVASRAELMARARYR